MLSQKEKVLLAAVVLDEQGAFAAEDLVVAVWDRDPNAFGLRGHLRYPDSHKVLGYIMGSKGLVGMGWLSRIEGTYCVSYKGKAIAKELAAGKKPKHSSAEELPTGPAVELPQFLDATLKRRLDSEAWSKWREGRQTDLVFDDAFRFCGSSPVTRDAVASRLKEAKALGGVNGALLSDGREVSGKELHALVELQVYLETRFPATKEKVTA